MLVISRQTNEWVQIGEARVEVIGVKPGGRVRLGITAPRVVPVHRGEIHDIHVEQDERTMRTVWGSVEAVN